MRMTKIVCIDDLRKFHGGAAQVQGQGKEIVWATLPVNLILANKKAAEAALELLEAHVLAIWEYEQNITKRALYLTTQCHGDSAKWAPLLQGIILEDQANELVLKDTKGANARYDAAIANYKEAFELLIGPTWAYPKNLEERVG
jgi:hypothetical protein